MVLEKQDSTVIDQFSGMLSRVVRAFRRYGLCRQLRTNGGDTVYLKEKKGSKFLPGETICVCVCVCAVPSPPLALVCSFCS